MAAKGPAALGFKVRTGRAVIVAVCGPRNTPEILGKTRIDVATTFDEGAVFHVGQELPLEEAKALVRDSEARFVERARAALLAFVEQIGIEVAAAVLVAGPAKKLPPIGSIMKAHPLVHAAEGELYRRVFAEAGTAALGVRPTRVPDDELVARVASAVGITPARTTARLAAMGKVSGRPWAADQKQAALGAWIALVSV